ncbi:MAG: DsbA family protein [Gammaproteobacteria bacterium]|nr:DsbA family protein [Gammaproteobacteria bacterium]
MKERDNTPRVQVEVYSDYICPFCYIGYLRLEKLRGEFDVDAEWRFLEIHPDNPPEGKPVTELGYPPEHWEKLMANLARMAKAEGVTLPERTFTTNSRRALKLAQAVHEEQPGVFETLNREMYGAYFLRGENIGDPAVLESLAAVCGVDPVVVQRAWDDRHYDEVLDGNQRNALKLRITGTPTYVFGNQVYSGAIPLEMMRNAAAAYQRP